LRSVALHLYTYALNAVVCVFGKNGCKEKGEMLLSNLEPILRRLILQLQRQRCRRLERYSKWNKLFPFSKTR
jgi:hypothetical protein